MSDQHDALLDDHDVLVAANRDLHHRADVDREALENLLASVWLYVPWHYVSSQLAAEQKELWADSIDAAHARMNADSPVEATVVERWWRQ